MTSGIVNRANGHDFKKVTFKKPTYCHHCSEFIWGFALQGVKCEICGFISHEKCEADIVTPCSYKAPLYVRIPRSHTLIKLIEGSRRRFCNVCRSKLDDTDGYECSICSYYVHRSCVKKIVHNCKIYDCYCTYTGNFKCKQQHHWCEGHLPLNSKCKVCQKICASVDCLTGMRCSWCLTTMHSYCVSEYHRNCSFGILCTVMLPPQQVVKHFHFGKLKYQPCSHVEDDICQQEVNVNGNDHQTKSVRIYQGSVNDDNKVFSEITITDISSTADALADVLHKFNISDEQSKFYLTKYCNVSGEVKLDEEERIWTYTNEEEDTCSFFLRCVHLDQKELRVTLYAGLINTHTESISMVINIMSNASTIIMAALKQFKLPIENADRYCITRMKVTCSKVKEVVIPNYNSIYDVLVLQRRLSIQELHNTRFYLQPKPDEVEVLSIFVSNLPCDISRDKYKVCIMDALGKWDENMDIVATFPAFGSVVVEFKGLECYNEYAPLFQNLLIENKSIKIMLLAEIKKELLPSSISPIIVFVNCKSGGGQGYKIFVTLRRLLNPHQVIDILDEGPLPILYMFRHLPIFRILVCGGDGTVGWVLAAIEEIQVKLTCQFPPTAILPLGTGNDLSRVLNWGAGYSGECCLELLEKVIASIEVKLDRWNVICNASTDDPVQIVPMTNYLGVGMDAKLSLEFHLSREENPEKFSSRFRNKGVYFKAGLKNLHSSSLTNLQERLTLEVDGRNITLPYVEGIAVNNISSWAAGADPWGNDPDLNYKPQKFNDGLLEVIGFTGVYHMGKIKSGISSGIRIAQGSLITINLKDSLPVQVDGEPWMQDPCTIKISPVMHQARMLANRNPLFRSGSDSATQLDRNRQRGIRYMHRRNTDTGGSFPVHPEN